MNMVPAGRVRSSPGCAACCTSTRFFVSLVCGVALILAASDGRARVAAIDLRRRRVGAARHERAVSPRHLAAQGAALDAPPRPLDDLRADRRHLHPGGAARAEGLAGEHDPDRAVGGRARRRHLQAAVDRRAEVAVRGGLRRARAGHRGGLRRAAGSDRLARRRRARVPAACCTWWARSSTRAAGRTRGRRCSATTRSSTRSCSPPRRCSMRSSPSRCCRGARRTTACGSGTCARARTPCTRASARGRCAGRGAAG